MCSSAAGRPSSSSPGARSIATTRSTTPPRASRRSWAGLVAAFGQQMRLLDGPPDLARYADSLHAVTAGRIGPLRRILSFALMTMLESKIDDPAAPEVLTDEHLAVAARQQVKATRKPRNGRAA